MIKEVLKDLIPKDFADESRVWIFQSNRPFSLQETIEVNEQVHQFAVQWHAHGKVVKGFGKLLFNRFIVMMADETCGEHVSGCSSDEMMRLIKSIERQYSVQLFDRLTLTFLVKDKIEILPLNQVQYALDHGYINMDTCLFNNQITTKAMLMSEWIKPIKDSWLAQKVKAPTY